MADLSDLIGGQGRPAGTCKLGRALTKLDPDDAEVVRQAIGHPEGNVARIARWMADNGFLMAQQTVRRHRNGDCGCD